MSQNQPESSCFYPDQDRLAIEKLSACGTGLGTATETLRGATTTTQEIDNKTRSRNNLSPLGHFIEHLVDVFEKLLQENNLDHKSLRLSTRWLETQPSITCKPSTRNDQHKVELWCARELITNTKWILAATLLNQQFCCSTESHE
jgi:hypothetical protein